MLENKVKELLSQKKEQSKETPTKLSAGEMIWKFIKKERHYIIGIAVLIALVVSKGGISQFADETKSNLQNDFGVGSDTSAVSEQYAEDSGAAASTDTEASHTAPSQELSDGTAPVDHGVEETDVTEPLRGTEAISDTSVSEKPDADEEKETEEYKSSRDKYNEYLAKTCDDISNEDALYHDPEFMEQKMRANDPDHYRYDKATGRFVPIEPEGEN